MSPARRAAWTWVAVVAAVAGGGALLLPAGRGGTGRSLWLGVVAAGLMLVCALLGARKRFLRLRLGSIAAWTTAHNGLGALALLLGLLHCEFQWGGVITTALLLVLGLLTAIGLVGSQLQILVPRHMTARLARESARTDFDLSTLEHWRSLHEHLVQECGPLPDAEQQLRRLEEAEGLPSPETREAEGAGGGAGRKAIAAFYSAEMLPFFVSFGRRGALADTSRAQLAMDALRANVDPSLHALVDRLQDTVESVLILTEERRLHRVIFDWQLVHIPLAMLAMLLLAVHVAAALYY